MADPQGGGAEATGPHRQHDPTAEGAAQVKPPAQGRNMQMLQGIVEKLGRQMERGEVDPKVLAELGWTEQDARKFVEKYKGRLDNRRPERDHTPIPTRTEQEQGQAGDRRQGLSVDARLRAIRDGAPTLDKDQLRRLFESPRGTVSPEYRELLEEYWKALAEAE